MKLDKGVVQRRVDLLAAEGIEFRTSVNVGKDITAEQLKQDFDAVLLACGALKARELDIPGRDLDGVTLAMDYLTGVTKSMLDSEFADGNCIDTNDKHVIVIGGGDTGADCIGTALRQKCKTLMNITRREREPDERDASHPWPNDPGIYMLDYSHAEGAARFGRDPREYQVLPLEFLGDENGRLRAIKIEMLKWSTDPETGKKVSEQTGDIKELPADYVFLSIGFTGHDTPEIIKQFGVDEEWGAVKAAYGKYATNVDGVFAAGDMRRGASLIVWAIAEGRGAARAIDESLMGHSALPSPGMDSSFTGMSSTAG